MSNRSRMMFLLKYLRMYTDDFHRVTLDDIQKAAEKQGFRILPKPFNSDLEQLRVAGFDIQVRRKTYTKTYHLERSFSMAERRRMIRAVKESDELTARQKNVLMRKLLDYGSVYEREMLLEDAFDE